MSTILQPLLTNLGDCDDGAADESALMSCHDPIAEPRDMLKRHSDHNAYTLLLLNARSINNKMHLIGPYIILSSPHVVMITETWHSADSTDAPLQIPGYSAFCSGRVNQRGGGCLIYVSNEFHASSFNVISLGNPEDSVWIQAAGGPIELLIGCIYNPPHCTSASVDQLAKVFHEVSFFPAHYKIIGGDFNMPHVSWLSHSAPSRYRAFFDTVFTHGWTQHVHSPTRQSNTLDLIFTSGISHACASVLDSIPGSDHKVVSLSFQLPKPTHHVNPTYYVFRPLQRMNWEVFSSLLRAAPWDAFFLAVNVDTAVCEMYNNFTHCLDVLAPEQSKIRQTRTVDNATTRRMANKLRKMRSRYNKTKDFHLMIRMNEILTEWRNAQIIDHASAERTALCSQDRVKSLIRLMKNRSGRNDIPIAALVLPDKTVLTEAAELCNFINTHFCDAFTRTDLALPNTTPKLTDDQLPTIDFNLHNINRALRSLKVSHHLGPDGIPSSLLILGGPDIPILLLNAFTLSMKSGEYPTIWKHAIVVPRHKRGCRQNIDNYRPISHTPFASRVMERIVKEEMLQFLLLRNLINRSQHGFLPAKSCQTCQFEFLNYVTQSIDLGRALVIIFLDMKKAFDRVPHKGLLTKLAAFGVADQLLSWFSSYLSNRTQSVKLGGESSKRTPVTSGVFQGSVLGPLLFLLYINDVFQVFKHGTPYIFADDIKVVFAFDPNNIQNGLSHIQSDLSALENWCNLWRLEFSPTKCNVLSYRCSVPPNSLTLNGASLANGSTVRDLGVHYSSSLNFAEQASYSSAKARSIIGYIMKSVSLLESRLTLYKVCARPILEYCSIVVANSRKSDRMAIEKVQRSFTKRLLGSSDSSYQDRCKQLGLEPLWLRRLKINLVFLYKLVKISDSSIGCYFQLTGDTRYPLRKKAHSFSLPKTRRNIRFNFFLYRYAYVWNRLPSVVRASDNAMQFSSAINRLLSVPKVAEIMGTCISEDELWKQGLDHI